MTPKGKERADSLARRMEDERFSWHALNYPGHKKMLDLLRETQDYFGQRMAGTEDVVALHSEDIKALMGHIQALAMRLKRIEEKLGIAEPVEMPGD